MVEIGPFFASDWFYFIYLCRILLRLSHLCPSTFNEESVHTYKENRSFKSEIESECKANKVHVTLLMRRSRKKGIRLMGYK